MASPMASAATPGGAGTGALEGAKIFVAGGGSGMGAAIARMAAARDAHVTLAGRTQEKLDAVEGELGKGLLSTVAVDLADAAAVEAALAVNGPYDHIVCTAAQLTFAPFLDLTDAQIQGMIASKLWGPINLARAAAKHLSPQGSVLLFSGLAAYRQGEGSSLVGALNMGLESLIANLAIEMKPKRFNAISPGIVDSGAWDGMGEEGKAAFFAGVAEGLPAGRVGRVEDEAHAALAILENGFINGTVVNVDGGGRIA